MAIRSALKPALKTPRSPRQASENVTPLPAISPRPQPASVGDPSIATPAMIERMLTNSVSKVLKEVMSEMGLFRDELGNMKNVLGEQLSDLKRLLQHNRREGQTLQTESAQSTSLSSVGGYGNTTVAATTGGYRKNIYQQGSKQGAVLSKRGSGPLVPKFSIYQHFADLDPFVHYDITSALGEGSFGVVSLGRHKLSNEEHAIKQITKNAGGNDHETWKEVDIMKQLRHPHVVTLHFTYEDSSAIYLVSELCRGGEMFDALTSNIHGFTERIVAKLMQQMVSAVEYLHTACRICHRDLKPENFLLSQKKDNIGDTQIKLADFGTAKSFAEGSQLVTKVCTLLYVAPEVLKKGDKPYTHLCDLWSLGVIMFLLLSGRQPFHGQNDMQIIKAIKKGHYKFEPRSVWSNISPDAIELLQNLLTSDTQARYTAKAAGDHVWVAKLAPAATDVQLLPPGVFEGIKRNDAPHQKAVVEDLVLELKSGASHFEDDSEGEQVRVVELCLLRIIEPGGGLILIRRSRQSSSGESKEHNDLPGKKILPRETCWSAAQRVIYSDMRLMERILKFPDADSSPLEQLVEEKESSHFAGIKTRYIKTFIDLDVDVTSLDDSIRSATSLPSPRPGTQVSFKSEDGTVTVFEWMSKEYCVERGIAVAGLTDEVLR